MATVHVTTCDCGFRSKQCRSAAQADYTLRVHRCERHRERADARARGEATRAAVDRTPKPCLHKIAEHVHGTHACYVLDVCRCRPCSRANVAYERHRARQKAYGRHVPYVDAQPTREHVQRLMEAGIGLKQIVKVSGISQGVLWKLIYGKTRADGTRTPSVRIRYETAVRLQVVHPSVDLLAAGARVPAVGTHRRVQALVAAGWSQSQVCARVDMNRTNFGLMMQRDSVTARTARAVAHVFGELWNQPPPESTHRQKIAASRARRHALEREWAVAGAWSWGAETDVWTNIDDPTAHPNATGYDPQRVTAVMAGALLDGDVDLELALTRTDRMEVLRRGRVDHRWPTAETARRTGLSARQLRSESGFVPKYAIADDLDEVLVERIMSGDIRLPASARSPERVEAVRRLAATGLSDGDVADRLGLTTSGVQRIRERNAIGAATPDGRIGIAS